MSTGGSGKKMSTGGSGKKRKRGDLVVMSMNVAGVDPDAFVRAFKKIKPDIVVTQEHPAANNHPLNVELRSAINTLNADKATNTEVQYAYPELTPEYWNGGLMMTDNKNRTFVCHPNKSQVKQYAFIFNRNKFRVRQTRPGGSHQGRQTQGRHAEGEGQHGGRRPGLQHEAAGLRRARADQRQQADRGVQLPHRPPQDDHKHGVAMDHFEQSDTLAMSKKSNHMTIIAGDLNDELDFHMKDFAEEVDRKFDHIIAHNADSHEDLQTEHGDVLDNLGTKIQDHYAMACEFKFK